MKPQVQADPVPAIVALVLMLVGSILCSVGMGYLWCPPAGVIVAGVLCILAGRVLL